MSRPLIAFLCALCLIGAACGSGGEEADAEAVPTLTPGTIVEVDPEGFLTVLERLEGRPLVVNFWATWCDPCKEEMPRLVDAARTYSGRVRFLGVDVEDSPSEAERFLRDHGVPFPSVGDPEGDIRRAQEIVGLPTTRFYRSDGELAFAHSGEIDTATLTERLEDLVQVGDPPTTPEAE